MRKWVVAGAILTLLSAPGKAVAWNNTGHMTVALIAYRELTDGQKLAIAKVLKEHPHYEEFLAADRPAKVSENEWAFLRAATWPDWVRPESSPSCIFRGLAPRPRAASGRSSA